MGGGQTILMCLFLRMKLVEPYKTHPSKTWKLA
jgi:hypothetical protein